MGGLRSIRRLIREQIIIEVNFVKTGVPTGHNAIHCFFATDEIFLRNINNIGILFLVN
ncbi:hypothetical protein FLGSB24_05400 [Flavobacterium sp. GSB-24]|jgi:hypothetical protein|nr:hypothetical protein FLGSB24_05400 [Flavobacterium sp. GSB-24]